MGTPRLPTVLAGAAVGLLVLGLVAGLALRQPNHSTEPLPQPPAVSSKDQAHRDSETWRKTDEARTKARDKARDEEGAPLRR